MSLGTNSFEIVSATQAWVNAAIAAAIGAADDTIRNVNFDGGGFALTTGLKAGTLVIPFTGVIGSVTMYSDISTTTVIDIWNDTYGNFPPTIADTITAAAKPTITAGIKSVDSTLTGWTTAVTAGDVLYFNIDSNDNATWVALALELTR